MITAFIPARCGSKSIPKKNIKPFCGKPLIFWNLSQLQATEEIDRIVVATDCEEYEAVVTSFGFNKVEVYRRRIENARDESSTEDVILEFLAHDNPNPEDLFILAQCTSPFTRSSDFQGGIQKLLSSGCNSLLSCVRIKRFFWTENGAPINYDYRERPRRQEFQGTLVENGAFYISIVQNILESKNRLSGKILPYEMPEYSLLEIDEEFDWAVGEMIMQKYVIPHISVPSYNRPQIKLFLSDVDGVLTDGGMYYSENGDELKKFHTYDGVAFSQLKAKGILTGIITSEDRALNRRRAEKLQLDYAFHGVKNKLEVVEKLCEELGISLENVAYIGDDINCLDLLSRVGVAACPANATDRVKGIPGITILSKSGGEGVLREVAEIFSLTK
jgi:N-acylneuraminate cytidylyltransferase